MIPKSKEAFIKTFIPDTIKDINFAQIDMDITDLALADILRNVNKTFPKNSHIRNAIASGNHAVGILCKTELIYPLSGLLLIVTGDDNIIELISKNYLVISVQEDDLTSDEKIKQILENITKYIIVEFKDSIEKFHEFYAKFIYDEYEMESEMEEFDYNELYERFKKK